jgi:hypothetical protein
MQQRIASALFVLATAIAATATTSTSASAGGPPPSPNPTTTITVVDKQATISSALAAKLQTGAAMTDGELRAAGIRPGMTPADGSPPPVAIASPSGVTTQSASGCDWTSGLGSVCIYVVGTGLWVSDWDTSAAISLYRCAYAIYWVNAVVTGTSNTVCGSFTTFWAYYNPNRNYSNNTTLCVRWSGVAGLPCVKITR